MAAEQNQTTTSVYRVLDQLAESDRRILILFELEEMSADQVGEVLGIKPANARVRLHRARARFLRVYERKFRSDRAMFTEAKLPSERYKNVG